MGTINQGILGGFSGTVGTVVGGFWNGISYLRARANNRKDAQSQKQINQRNRFKAAVNMAKSIRLNVIRPIWNKKAVRMSGYNLFVKTNSPFFDEDGLINNYENFKISVGDLPLPTNIVAQNNTSGNGALIINWLNNSGQGIAASTDRINVLALVGNEPYLVSGLTYNRASQEARLQVPYAAGTLVHLYIFFENADASAYSESFHASVLIEANPSM